jgi:hypothetical protein
MAAREAAPPNAELQSLGMLGRSLRTINKELRAPRNNSRVTRRHNFDVLLQPHTQWKVQIPLLRSEQRHFGSDKGSREGMSREPLVHLLQWANGHMYAIYVDSDDARGLNRSPRDKSPCRCDATPLDTLALSLQPFAIPRPSRLT